MIILPYKYIHDEKILTSHKVVTYDSNKIRLDAIELKQDRNKFYLCRSTHFGNVFNKYFDIREFIASRTNLISGELEVIESSVTNDAGVVNELPSNYISFDGRLKTDFMRSPVYMMDKLKGFDFRKGEIWDNKSLPMYAYAFEDNFNMEYAKGIGNLASIVTGANISAPFRCDVIIDNIYGYNIKNIKLLMSEDADIREIFKEEFKELGKSIKLISDFMKRDYDRLKNSGNSPDHIRIYCGIREFDTIIRAVNIDCNEITMDFKLNNSDHIRTLMTSMSSLGENYMSTESFGDLIDCKVNMTYPSMFLSEEYRENFQVSKYPDNFTATYN